MKRTLCALVAVTLAPMAVASDPYMAHQGRLLDSLGAPVEGRHSLTVTLYTSQSGADDVWQRTFPNVSFDGGYYTVPITGDDDAVTPRSLDGALGEDALWIGVTVDSGTELVPRQRMASFLGASGSATARATSCRAIREADINALSGSYTIDPDGDGGVPQTMVYCDMTPDGKGWTRIDVGYLQGTAILTETGGVSTVSGGEIRYYPSSRDTESWHDYDIRIPFEQVRGSYVYVPHSHPDDNAVSACIAETTYTTRLTTGSGNVSWQRFGVPGKVVKTCGEFGGEYTSNRTFTFGTTSVPTGRVLRWSGGDESGAPGAELYGIRDIAVFVY